MPRASTLFPGHADAIRRWKLGHQVFHLKLIVMNSTLVELHAACGSAHWEDAERLLHRLTCLYDAATASMKYAADFPPHAYRDLIRPSMDEPFLSPGFSGTLNHDHGLMLDHLRELRTRLRQHRDAGTLPRSTTRAAKALWSAQARNRRHHLLVCERFVPGGESQLREFLGRQDTADH
ncbi:hypothetical protein [Amycolatopsis sp. EV170708-02-1]|uniref:hypothetical protein n=1 Tax=Amycolatopsis sp. EV170708-02-1 TaxID=2919322 RepID=UPI001F0B7BF6|nr:hypothetical protein [Amycolatopsis sp. EV170708-02-1]UMO99830.1 hypothetical protein MJQ72_25285 [Amycolatopsis sp. EV170708-02-1]